MRRRILVLVSEYGSLFFFVQKIFIYKFVNLRMPRLKRLTREDLELLRPPPDTPRLTAQSLLDAFFKPLLEGGHEANVKVEVINGKGKGVISAKGSLKKGDRLYSEPVLAVGSVDPGSSGCAHCLGPCLTTWLQCV